MIKKLVAILLVGVLLSGLLVVSVTVVATPAAEMIPVIIMFKDRPHTALIEQYQGDIKTVYHLQPALAASLPPKAVENLERNPKIAYIVRDLEIYTMGEVYDWGVARIDADVVHAGGNTGEGIKVAILDTGIDYTHPDLAANYAGGTDCADKDDDPMDVGGHGTHCAGIVAAALNDAGVIGVAPGAELYAVKVFTDSGGGSYSDVISALEWCIENDIQVISMSFGSSYRSGDPGIEPWINAAYNAGIVLVGAAGNDGNRFATGDSVIYPARYSNVIAVAATDRYDKRASFSSTGPAVELAAPGVAITSTVPGGAYEAWSGTSMACPHVAGTAALVIGSGITDNEAVRLCLQATAEDLGAAGKDNLYGYGLVDAEAAAALPAGNEPPVADAGGPYSGTTGVAVAFDGSGSYDPDGDPLTYTWAFGDGSTGTGVQPTHVYSASGTYTVTLVVNDGSVDSEPSTATATISEGVVNAPPVADAGPDQTALVGAVVLFNGSGSYDSDGTITAYDWDFDDGSTGSGKTTTHAYGTAGTYTVVLTVTDDRGSTATDEATVTATAAGADVMHVASIGMSTESRTAGKNTFVCALATVTVADAAGVPVAGASVAGRWSGAATDSDSGLTDATGAVTLTSDSVKLKTAATFTFTVTDVNKDGWTYDPAANTVTSGSIAWP
ncbi:MAG TPA: PKD domain-containing protein [Methanomicrobia archaeon]|nr:PKD domain-containing protein [Methanomicrobia archaeon]